MDPPGEAAVLSAGLFRTFNLLVETLALLSRKYSALSSQIYHSKNPPPALIFPEKLVGVEGVETSVLLNRSWEQVLLSHATGEGSSLGLDLLNTFISLESNLE